MDFKSFIKEDKKDINYKAEKLAYMSVIFWNNY